MKKMRKIFAVLLTVAMVMGLNLTAFAAEGDETYSITINNSATGHTYEAYQIFAGELYAEDGKDPVLSNIEWGTGVSEDGKTAMGDAEAKAESLKTTADAEAFAQEVAQYLTDEKATSKYDEDAKQYVIENLEPGYYLIKDMDNSLDNTTEGYTSYILKVVEDVTTDVKSGSTTAVKKVDDKNDSNTTENEIIWQDSADHDIGDRVSFKLEATIAENYADYDTYYLAFHDKESEGLTFDASSVEVYVDGKLITSGYEVVTATEDGCTFEVVFEDLKAIDDVQAGSVITVTYESELNEKAVIGSEGNPNTMYAEFSNNPNSDQGGDQDDDEDRGKTEDDTVIVFTYKVIVNKVDEDGKALTGAEFTLEKFVVDENGTDELDGVKGTWTAIDTVETTPGSTFTFEGLDDGEYRLVENDAPDGYNKIDPIYFTVTASHDIESDDPQLTALSGIAETGEITFTADVDAGSLSTDVENKQGATLPETGGIGTTIFYVVGAILVLGAAVLLITKKRMSAE